MRLIDADRLLSERMKSMYYHLPNGDIAIPIIDIENAPTIEPKRDTGEWIPYTYVAPDDWYQDKEIRYRCSKCCVEVINKSNFCPDCGAKMMRETKT